MGDEFPKVILAAVQAAPIYLEREKTVEKACSLIKEAGAKGARVIGFPESFIPGHPYWYKFNIAPSSRSRYYYLQLFKNAVEIPSDATKRLCQATAEAKAYVIMGICERIPNTTGTLFNSQLFIGPDGEVKGVHRKLVPTVTERLVHGSGDGADIGLVKTPFGDIGGAICGENTNSLYRFYLLSQGEKIHVASWPAWVTESEEHLKEGADIRARNHAFEGKIFVINAFDILKKETAEELCPPENKDSIKIVSEGGHSSIIGPKGNFLAGPVNSEECILYAEMDYDSMIQAKMVHDVIGHYNRFDIFKLYINNRKNNMLVSTGKLSPYFDEKRFVQVIDEEAEEVDEKFNNHQ